MTAMTVEITLAPDEAAKLRERASALGQDLPTFVREAALEKAGRPTFAELLAPAHDATRRGGITVDEVDEMADRARAEHWAERAEPDRDIC